MIQVQVRREREGERVREVITRSRGHIKVDETMSITTEKQPKTIKSDLVPNNRMYMCVFVFEVIVSFWAES